MTWPAAGWRRCSVSGCRAQLQGSASQRDAVIRQWRSGAAPQAAYKLLSSLEASPYRPELEGRQPRDAAPPHAGRVGRSAHRRPPMDLRSRPSRRPERFQVHRGRDRAVTRPRRRNAALNEPRTHLTLKWTEIKHTSRRSLRAFMARRALRTPRGPVGGPSPCGACPPKA